GFDFLTRCRLGRDHDLPSTLSQSMFINPTFINWGIYFACLVTHPPPRPIWATVLVLPDSAHRSGTTTQTDDPEQIERKPYETTRRQIAPWLSQGELGVGTGSRVRRNNDRRGVCRFEIQNYGGRDEPRQCYTTRQRAASRQDRYSSVSFEFPGNGTRRFTQTHKRDKVA